ncbi:type I restriction endonuclease [Pontiellaceae bacterium B12219]|nr:type I restriction endonuclease [Pontiellaceae bacterium B12219]
MLKFNEDSRVKIPAILHLVRLGYTYLPKSEVTWDETTNIFPGIFRESICRINPDVDDDATDRLLEELRLLLDFEDLGKSFYERLIEKSGVRLIDFEDFNNNSFHVLTELPCKNGDEEFRPDITLLINGMPLVFIEVKKPNNKEGILAERNRIDTRFKNSTFRRFANITQLMVFSNNMEYDDESPEPIEGAFYATPAYGSVKFNYFREEENRDLSVLLKPEDNLLEDTVLRDNNLEVIKHNPEFLTNKDPDSPTNRLSSALFSRDRLAFLLNYAFAYVKTSNGHEKHIMRYPQLFATKAIEAKLDEGERKGIIWHTQGSGKTALAYYNVKHLTDYFTHRGIIPKFYFIVDRIDLLIQASTEFSSRGLVVKNINSRDEFAREIRATKALHNLSGKPEITVVNIQKFKDDPDVVTASDYDVDVQRIYFLDEVHRSYNPKGSFLANLTQSDRKAIKIGLTGTPLLGNDTNSRKLFGGYIHKYYYNASIADGYTLRLIREEIETSYKMQLKKALEEMDVKKSGANKKLIYAHENYTRPLLDYILDDFENARLTMNDPSIGGMVICDSSEQAKSLFEQFEKTQQTFDEAEYWPVAADAPPPYKTQRKEERRVKRAALILHDVGTKEERKAQITEFKEGKIDLLFVYNMLLTGFDAPRLKKLYLNRIIRKHNLLQALTRVNRTYKNFKYGYVVDFADIMEEFEATNEAYMQELQLELGDEFEHYSQLFKSEDEIKSEIEAIKDILFRFDCDNAEIFQQQISEIADRKEVLAIKKALGNARELYNLIRFSGRYELLEMVDFKKLNLLYREVSNHLGLLNLKASLEGEGETANLMNQALEDIVFMFSKVGEEELKLADELKDMLRKTREAMTRNFDPEDPGFVKLREELERLFKTKKLQEVSQEEMNQNMGALSKIHDAIQELNRKNEQLKAKYHHDPKYTRIHKRMLENHALSLKERMIHEALMGVKTDADSFVLQNSKMLENEAYFSGRMMPLVIDQFKTRRNLPLNADTSRFINGLVVNEYLNEFNGTHA